MKHPKAEPIFSVSGILDLEGDTKVWLDDMLLAWLKAGFAKIDNRKDTFDVHLAFQPLRFHPDSAPIGQLASALSESLAAGLGWPVRIRKLALHRAQVDVAPDEQGLAEMILLWRCMPALAPEADTAQAARRMLPWIGKLESRDLRLALIQAAVEAVSAAPPSPSQFNFFRSMKQEDHQEMWRPDFVKSLLISQLDVAERQRKDAWIDLCRIFADDIARVMEPVTPKGCALIRSTARRLLPEAFAAEPPAELRAKLLSLTKNDLTPRPMPHMVVRSRPELARKLELVLERN